MNVIDNMDEGESFPVYQPPGMGPDVIIFHPGSRHLYVGRASDPIPIKILHTIARKRKPTAPQSHRDSVVPTLKTSLCENESENALSQLESAKAEIGFASQSDSEPNVEGFEKRTSQKNDFKEANENYAPRPTESIPMQNAEFVIGEAVLEIGSAQPYNIHHPWQRGQLNLHGDIGGSITSVMCDLEEIWKWCLHKKLGILLEDMNKYKAIVIIPVMFDRVHAKELMNLLFRLGFNSAFLIQDHICSSFGCGVACATVVDIGDQKISVSCVEDGVSYPQSRLELKFGGIDLTIKLWRQLQFVSFPIPIDITQSYDLDYVRRLKEKLCHLDVNDGDPFNYKKTITLSWNKPGQPLQIFNVDLGHELMIVPMCYFNPDLLWGIIGTKAVFMYGPQPSVSDDPFDKIYLVETSKKPGSSSVVNKETEGDLGGEEDFTLSLGQMEESKTPPLSSDRPIGIDQAIIQSISHCNVSDVHLKSRLLSCIVLVGGGSKIPGLPDWLKKKLNIEVKRNLTAEMNINSYNPRVIQNSRLGEPATTTWKGAAILSSLETAKELWISSEEWNRFGSKILREKSLFQF